MASSNLEILAYEDTPLGPLCLRRRELLSSPGTVVTEVTLNHAFLMSSYNTASERALSRNAIEMHGGSGLKVLVGGLGLGYTAEAALLYPEVSSVEVVEYLPEVIDWFTRGLIPLADTLSSDPRFSTSSGDVYAMLGEPATRLFDVILIDVDHSPDDQLSSSNDWFYTEDGLRRARAHLAPGGVLGVWSSAESSSFSRALREVFQEVRVESVAFFNQMTDEENVDWLFFAR
jgi:spermidine synthase